MIVMSVHDSCERRGEFALQLLCLWNTTATPLSIIRNKIVCGDSIFSPCLSFPAFSAPPFESRSVLPGSNPGLS